MNMATVRIQKLYDDIIQKMEWDQDPNIDIENKTRTLRNKFGVLLQKKMCCDPDLFYKNGGYEVSVYEAPIIRNILLGSLQERSLISMWFKGNLNLADSENTIRLYEDLYQLIVAALGESNEVTVNEWLTAIDGSIDYSNAFRTSQMKLLLEQLRATAKPINHTTASGEVIVTYEDGSRVYALPASNEPIEIGDLTIKEIMQHVSAERDYFELLNILIATFIEHAKEASYNEILCLAQAKAVMDDNGERNSARDFVQFDNVIASDYLQRYRNMYDYLKDNPQVVQEIESTAGTSELLKFFDVTGDSKYKKKKQRVKTKV